MIETIYIDKTNKIIMGKLKSCCYNSKQMAETALLSFKRDNLVPNVRKGSLNQWFAVIENKEGIVEFMSESYNNYKTALTEATASYRLISEYMRGIA
jgi:hypothetical protein